MSATTSDAQQPTAPRQRIVIIDILRGYALLGILLANILFFSSPTNLIGGPFSYWEGPLDRVAEGATRVLVEGAFYAIFSFLFGLGIALQLGRGEGSAAQVARVRWRLFILIGFGALHGIFVWYGDILLPYAVGGLVLLLFRRFRVAGLLVWAVLGLGLSSLIYLASALSSGGSLPDWYSAANFLSTYRDGSYPEILALRVRIFLFDLIDLPFLLPNLLWLFLMGMVAGRLELFARVRDHLPLFRRALVVGLLFALALKGAYAWSLVRGDPLPVGLVSFGTGGPALAFVYICGLTLLHQRAFWSRLLGPLAAVGKMALTNYLAQSVVCSLIFYGYGLGYYGQLGPAVTVVIAFAIYGVQIVLSVLWLRAFRFGPMEWLWRTLTYGERQPLRR
ncbi:MAG: DUF418 domain-containing protein [Trueperaceae bacterium]|nr:DUF418 domain-containing protein [Trueperaceae bacterium]